MTGLLAVGPPSRVPAPSGEGVLGLGVDDEQDLTR